MAIFTGMLGSSRVCFFVFMSWIRCTTTSILFKINNCRFATNLYNSYLDHCPTLSKIVQDIDRSWTVFVHSTPATQ
jgi:hypothetical protein